MRYQLHQKLISIGGGSIIQDGGGRDIFTVDSKGFGFGKNLEIKNFNGNVLANIKQKVFSGSPTFEVKLSNGLNAKMWMKGIFGPDRLKIAVAGQGEMEARGHFANHDYAIFRNECQISQASRAYITPGNALGDPYGIETDNNQDQMLLLCCAVVIDAIQELQSD